MRKNEKTATKATEQQIKLTSKRGNANSTKQTVTVLGLPRIGKSNALNQWGRAAAALLEALLAS